MTFRDEKQVDIFVRGWNNANLTDRCLQSIINNSKTGPTYSLNYVDNGSTHGNAAWLLGRFPTIGFYRLPFNHGSVRALNVGLALAQFSSAKFLLVLDNDTEIPKGDTTWLARWLSYFDDPKVGSAGATSDYVSGYQNIEQTPDRFQRDFKAPDGEGQKAPYDLPFMVSFGWMLRKEAIDGIGWFDETFEPGNWEDYDYSLRLRQAGWKNVIADSVYLHHRGSQTFGGMGLQDLVKQNESKFLLKWTREELAALGVQVNAK